MDGDKMHFISKEAQIEELAGRRKFCLTMDEKVKEYEKRMLGDGGCPHTLPMRFLKEEGMEKAYYDFTGFLPLTEYIKRKTADHPSEREGRNLICSALDVLSGTLDCLKGMENYLIYPERVSIHPDVIFIGLNCGKAAIAFYPAANTQASLRGRILALIDDVSSAYGHAETDRCLKRLKDQIYAQNPGLDGMSAALGTMQREISYIYWNSENFRSTEEKTAQAEREKQESGAGNSGEDFGKKTRMLRSEQFFINRTMVKPAAIQAVFAAALAAVFISGIMEPVNFAGVAVIAAGIDLWIMRKLRYIK